MARTVKVGLDVDEKPFTRGVERAAAATGRLEDKLDDVTDSARDTTAATERAADSVEDLGDSAKDGAKDLDLLRERAERLDRQIDETARSIRNLARDIAATSDEAARADLAKKLTIEQGKLRERVNLRKLIDVDSAADMGAELAGQVSVSFVSRLGPLLAKAPMASLNPAVAAIGGGLAAGLVPMLGAAVSGAVVGAAAGGGIIGGVVIASKHSAVKAAATATGDTFESALQDAASSFVPATVEALGAVRARIGDIEDDLDRAGEASARMLRPLTDDVLDGAERAVEGFATAVERSQPVVEALGFVAEEAGDLVGDTFEQLSEHAHEGARAIALLWEIFDFGARSLVNTISFLSEVFGWMEKVGAVMSGNAEHAAALAAQEEVAKRSGDNLTGGLRELIGGFEDTTTATSDATFEIETFEDAVIRLRDEALGMENAQLRMEEAIDRAAEAAKEGAEKGIDPNTEAGRRNRKALLDVAAAANANADAILESTGSHELAAEATERGRKKFLEAASAMGVEKGEAIALANKLFGIPKEVDTRADFHPDNKGVNNWKATLSGIPREIFTSARLRAIVNVEVRREQATEATGRRWGGVVEHAQWGRLREAQIASPVSPARYAWAEPATGGEAFIPRFGNRERSLDILSHAARWYGQQVVPAGAGMAVGSPALSPAQLAQAIRGALVGVSVQMDGRTVGYITGREADLFSRT